MLDVRCFHSNTKEKEERWESKDSEKEEEGHISVGTSIGDLPIFTPRISQTDHAPSTPILPKQAEASFQGWAPRPAGSPPRGEGGFPAPPRPVKMIKTAGKWRGKIKAVISTFSNRRNQ